jgi:uncharacterized protein YecE (DUF72 family)
LTRIGPAGWAYKDWWGIVYPAKKPRGFSELAYLSEYFDTVEINVTFYQPIPPKTATAWLQQVEKHRHFRFTAKLWRGFTHERTATAADEQEFKDGFAPILEQGKLGALLLQFPWSFRNTTENRDYLTRLCDRFAEFPLVLEVRHGSWADPGVLDLLEQLKVGLCNIDQPLFRRSITPSAIATSSLGYVRLHGRNYDSWWRESKYNGERYDYLYSVAELNPWVDRIKMVEQSAKDTYVVTNNHYIGKGVVNALEISSILKDEPLPMPPELIERYPELEPFAKKTQAKPKQSGLLFD